MHAWFPNPELEWERSEEVTTLALGEVERRIGPVAGPIHVVSGGLANSNVRIGDDAILRIYRRDPTALSKELTLLRRPWSTFRVPAVLATGDDFLLLEYVPHHRLQSTSKHGAAAGRALAEIHSTTLPRAGLLGPTLEVVDPFPDFITSLRDHTADQITAAGALLPADLGSRILSALDAHASTLRERAGPPVLLHGDYKPSNLHWTDRDELLVLDWEFAYAGSASMDIGQLFRWAAPPDFTVAFSSAYTTGGGTLLPDWQHTLPILGLVNLTGLLRRATPGSRRARDCIGHIEQTLQAL
jgi:aminoglycoside phosphotransferase (APT) family kinase protein